jgi:hypothetical protein
MAKSKVKSVLSNLGGQARDLFGDIEENYAKYIKSDQPQRDIKAAFSGPSGASHVYNRFVRPAFGAQPTPRYMQNQNIAGMIRAGQPLSPQQGRTARSNELGQMMGFAGTTGNVGFNPFLRGMKANVARETAEETASKAVTNYGRGGTMNPVEAASYNRFSGKSLNDFLNSIRR